MNAPERLPPVIEIKPVRVSLYERQPKVYPRSVSGRFARWRWVMVWLTQLVFYGMPWLTWNGRQAVLFDLETPRFFVFGLVLQPQELVFLVGLLVLSALALFFFTAVAGRLWCGYACPQTVYTEIFLWIERHTEGDRQARQRLDKAPFSANKLLRKGGKHAAWAAVGLLTGFSFVGYFLPIAPLAQQILGASIEPWPLFWVLFYGGITYGNAGWMREQVCKYMCPYARFQSTLLDADSLVIAYDTQRGEPRGSRRRNADLKLLGLGSCVDCTMCVQVCPTGIDIRHGLQNECIGCAACIDACDAVMDKLGDARGLIRYATANGVEQDLSPRQMWRRVPRARVWIYGALMLVVSTALVAGLAARQPVSLNVMRDRGALARLGEEGRVENVYRLQLANRSEGVASYRIGAEGLPGLKAGGQTEVTLHPGETRPLTLTLSLPADAALAAGAGSHPVRFDLITPGATAPLLAERSTFVVPR